MGQGLGVQAVDQVHQPGAAGRVVVLAQVDEALAQRFDGVQHLRTFLAGQHLSQQVAEQLDLGS